jgi:hypothetical protein
VKHLQTDIVLCSFIVINKTAAPGSNTRRLTGGAFSGASKGSARLPLSMSDVAEQFLADYYAGCVKLPASDANIVVTSSVSAHQYPWAKPEWGQYKQRAVVEADPTGKGPGLTVWAWDIVPEVGQAPYSRT